MVANASKWWMVVLLAVNACSDARPRAAPPPPSHLGTVTPEVRALFTELCGPRGVVQVRPAVVHGRPEIVAEALACQTDEPLRPAATMSLEYEVRTGELLVAQLAYGSEAFARAYIERVLARALAPVHAARMQVLRERAARVVASGAFRTEKTFTVNEPQDVALTIAFDAVHGDEPFWAIGVMLFPRPTPLGVPEGAR